MNLYYFLRNSFFALFLFVVSLLDAHSIVFVHIGSSLPKHLSTTIKQARSFNKECPIYVVANQIAIEKSSSDMIENHVTFIACEYLTISKVHEEFHNNRLHDWGGNGFWVYASERFFYLEEFMNQYQLSDVFHLENDIMLYVDLEEILPAFHKNYKGMIAATFENDDRCVPGLVYISDSKPLTALVEFLPNKVDIQNTDMDSLARFKDKYHHVFIDYLPIVVPQYADNHSLQAFPKNEPSKNPELFSNHLEDFDSIFDGAAWGVFLGGMDSTWHADSAPGKIDPYCIFNPSYFNFDWKIDSEARRVPYITYQGRQVRINNLHITNKSKIDLFLSTGR